VILMGNKQIIGVSMTELPTPGKTFRPDQPRNLAAGEKVRPLIKYTHRDNISGYFKESQSKILEKNLVYQLEVTIFA
jgi:hypothetical protein